MKDTSWGGKREGAGRKPKPVSVKIAEGNPGKRVIERLDYMGGGDNIVPPAFLKLFDDPKLMKEYIAAQSSEEGVSKRSKHRIPTCQDFYKGAVEFLRPTGCLPMVNGQLITNYAVWCKNFIECQMNVARFSQLAEGKNQKVVLSGFIEAAANSYEYLERAWAQIYAIVRDNCTKPITDELENNPLYSIMNGRLRKKTDKTEE
jgi:hypothetical protein